ncbi:hypothetical protein RYH70_13990 [Alloalcanivorax xenomutans]|uniref:hypothetical protein n=1 Tax=Alloalcanivorax xenomutans TaxID=1094342 RepID=UPI00293469F4|nr:hypothetical protein [Alloalcanivorax xenomutans]WOD27129.1 hypothetical protein RYH70_13990 [Alloalcanivorax xenomutans]
MYRITLILALLFSALACSASDSPETNSNIGCLKGSKTENILLLDGNQKKFLISSDCILENKIRENEIHINACLPSLSPCDKSRNDSVKLILARPLHNVVSIAMKSIPKVEKLQKEGKNINIYQSSNNKDTRIYLSTEKSFYVRCLETEHGACSVTGYTDNDIRYSLETKYDSSGRDWDAIHNLVTDLVKKAQLP